MAFRRKQNRVPAKKKQTPRDILLKPDDLARLRHLELVASRVVDGLHSGRHRSRLRGGSAEFSEHRAYNPGDNTRLLDWHAYGKTDRYYIKLYDEDTQLNALLLLDASASMGCSISAESKFDYAAKAAACLARLILTHRDSVGLAVTGLDNIEFLPPKSRPTYLDVILRNLVAAQPTGGDSPLGLALDNLLKRLRRRTSLFIFTDGFTDLVTLRQSLRTLRARGHDATLFHTLAPEEIDFAFTDPVRFESLDAPGHTIDLDPVSYRDIYHERLHAFTDKLRHICRESACEFTTLVPGQPLGEALARYLKSRLARAGARAAPR